MKRHHADWLKSYCDLLDGKTEAPRRFLFWSAVSCLAGALTRHVRLDETTFQYYPNFYVLLVSPPGAVKKTSTIDLAINLLRDLAEEKDHVTLGPDITSVEGLCQFIAELNQNIVVSDNSVMSATATWDNQCALTLSIGEFGTLYKSDDKALVNLLTDLFDCRSVPLWKHTKTQGDDIVQNPFVNIIAGTTPQFLQDEFKAQYGGWGLSSRIIFVFAGQKERSIYRPSKVLSSEEYTKGRSNLFADLRQIAELAGDFKLSDEADSWAEQWYYRTDKNTAEYVAQDSYNEWVAYFMARKQVHVHKLAMIFSAARRDTLVIEIDDIRDAAAQVEAVEKDLPKAFEKRMGPTAMAQTEQALIERIITLLSGGPVQRGDVIALASKFVDSITAGRLIESAIARKLISQNVRHGGGTWLVNGHAQEDC